MTDRITIIESGGRALVSALIKNLNFAQENMANGKPRVFKKKKEQRSRKYVAFIKGMIYFPYYDHHKYLLFV